MRRIFSTAFIALTLSAVCIPHAHATYAVHDAITYIHDTIKAVQDELYQQIDLDTAAEALSVGQDTLTTCRDTLKTARDTYDTAVNIYDTATHMKNYIGDPARMVAYINSRFWHDREISAALNVTKEALELADGDVCSTADIEFLLDDIDYSMRLAQQRQSEQLAKTQKEALATQEIMKNWEQKMLTQLRDLNTHDQQYDSRNSTLNELQHAAYKNSIWQSNTLGQMFAAQTVHSAMVAQQMYSDNMRQDEIDYKKAKAIHDSRKINESGASELEAKGSVGNNFIEQFINR